MIVYGIFVFRVAAVPNAQGVAEACAQLLASSLDLSSFSFFQRSTAGEILTFGNRQCAALARPQERSVVIIQNGAKCHVYSPAGAAGPQDARLTLCVTTDAEYPQRVAFSLAAKAWDVYRTQALAALPPCPRACAKMPADINAQLPALRDLVTQYQDPVKADPITSMQKELDETKAVLTEAMDELIKRGGSLEELVDKSESLSYQSKAFMKQSKDMNSCCTLL